MCGRFTQNYTWEEVRAAMGLLGVPRNLRPRYNIAPTTTVDVVRLGENGRERVPMRWGLIPCWWKKTAKEVPSTFNARAETPVAKHESVVRVKRLLAQIDLREAGFSAERTTSA
jgi:putative SOS response-associated peptidase YedK